MGMCLHDQFRAHSVLALGYDCIISLPTFVEFVSSSVV